LSRISGGRAFDRKGREGFAKFAKETQSKLGHYEITFAALASYSQSVSDTNAQTKSTRVGLCADCVFMRLIRSDRGTTFYFCERSKTDASFPKYPRLPVLQCAGYEKKQTDRKE
jgi:hypothetical protein